MKTKVKIEQEIEITHVRVTLPVRYEEEDIPNNFPLRKGDVWKAIIVVDTGEIIDWQKGRSGKLEMKVCDEGTYELLCSNGAGYDHVAEINEDYVPHGLIPGEYGDYVCFQINPEGIIENWPKKPDVAAFFDEE